MSTAMTRGARGEERRASREQASRVSHWIGLVGLAAAILAVLGSFLYYVPGTPPPLRDSVRLADYVARNHNVYLTRVLVDTLFLAGFVVFAAGLRHLIRQARPDYEWAATLVFGSALLPSVATVVGDALFAGAALDTFDNPDPSAVRALVEGSLPAFDVIFLVLMALFLVCVSYAISVTEALPRWTARVGYVAALVHLAGAPAIYGGGDFMYSTVAGGSASAGFYSYSISIAGLAFLVWLFSVSISIIRRREVMGRPQEISD